MKKFVLSALFSFVMILSLTAQTEFEKVKFSFHVDPFVSWMKTNYKFIKTNGQNLGIKLGLQGEYYFTENYAITAGLNLALNHGGQLRYGNGGEPWKGGSKLSQSVIIPEANQPDVRYKLNYLEFPFGFKFRTREFGYIRYYAEVPTFALGFLLKSTGNIGNAGTANIEDENIKGTVFPISFTWGLGGGFQYGISTETALTMGLFFQSSIIDITRDNGTIYKDGQLKDEDSKGVNNLIGLKLGIVF